MSMKKYSLVLAGVAAHWLGAAPAIAQTTTTVSCADTTILPNPVYLAGSSAFEPILAQLAVQIAAKQNVSVIYNPISSCTGVTAVADSTYSLSGTGHYYRVNATDNTKVDTLSCSITGGTKALVGVSDVAYDSCMGEAKPVTLGEWRGPVQSMLIIVPEANVTTTNISAEQAAAIWGCGDAGKVPPFTEKACIQQRSASSGTQILVARNIGVPESAFKGTTNSSGGVLVQSLLACADPQAAIGFLAADSYATQRGKLNALAFRGIKQKKAYYADSDANSVDKKNVRDGHYLIQGPLHFFSALAAGSPAASAKYVLEWLTGKTPIDPKDVNNVNYITTVASLGDVPQCAMKVQLDKDGGKFSPYAPEVSCNCQFEKAVSAVSAAPASCKVCTTDVDCTGGKRCQTGFCE